jgi:hypothetical protein
MPTEKRPGKYYSAEGSSQVAGGQVLETTTQPQASAEPHLAMADIRRPREPPEQPTGHAEAPPPLPSTPPGQALSHHCITKRPKLKRISSKIRKRRSKQSSKTSWHASIKRMSTCDSCRNSWPGERQWRKELRPCNNKSNKDEQLRQSCSEQ